MSILVVEAVSEGLIFAADKYITQTRVDRQQNKTTAQVDIRPKVLKWPNEKALIGYVGVAQINNQPMDEWLQQFINEFPDFASFEDLANELNRRVEAQRRIDEGAEDARPLLIHLGGFEERERVMVPVIWFIRNVYAFNEEGQYIDFRKEFQCSEEFWKYFSDPYPVVAPAEIRNELRKRAERLTPFWFHQGLDLPTFNILKQFVRGALAFLIKNNPRHSLPRNVTDWENHSRMQVLMYGAYYESFYPAGRHFVGGGSEVVSLAWPIA